MPLNNIIVHKIVNVLFENIIKLLRVILRKMSIAGIRINFFKNIFDFDSIRNLNFENNDIFVLIYLDFLQYLIV
jgi:hypothetical protein